MTISTEYRELNRRMHAEQPLYGTYAGRQAGNVLELCDSLGTRDVLDYGCGKGALAGAMPFPIREYDPAIAGKDEPPEPADIVACLDVLEHVEPEWLGVALADLMRVIRRCGFFVIHIGPSSKFLPDGRNAHLIQESPEWWEQTLRHFFEIARVARGERELYVVVSPKKTGAEAPESLHDNATS